MICANPNCQSKVGVQLHHLYSRALGCPDDLVVPLCAECHGRAHGMRFRADTAAVTKAALDRLRRQGRRTGSIPFGWRLVGGAGKQLEPEPSEQVVVELARGLRSAGDTLQAICDALLRAGHLSRTGKAFMPSQIQRMCAGVTPPKKIA